MRLVGNLGLPSIWAFYLWIDEVIRGQSVPLSAGYWYSEVRAIGTPSVRAIGTPLNR